MVEFDLERVLQDFFRLAESYIAEPDLRTGLQLDELAGQASSACTTHFGTESGLTGHFTEFLRALPKQDLGRLQQSLDAIRGILAELNPPA